MISLKIKKYFISFILILILIVSGCTPADVKTPSPKAPDDTPSETMIDDSWKTNGFAYGGFDYTSNTIWRDLFQELRCATLTDTTPDFAYASRKSLVSYLYDTRYELITYSLAPGSDAPKRYFLEQRRSDAEEVRQIELFTAGEEIPRGSAIRMDVVTESDIAVLFIEPPRKGSTRSSYQVLHLNGDGKVQGLNDLSSCFGKQQILEQDLSLYWQCDELGCSYAISFKQPGIYIYDDQGRLLMSHKLSYDSTIARPSATFHTPDGSPVFCWENEASYSTSIVWFDLTELEAVTLATLPTNYLRCIAMEKNGTVYYADTTRLWYWDILTGATTPLFAYNESDIPSALHVKHIARDQNGDLLVYTRSKDNSKDLVYLFSDRISEDAEGLRLLDFTDSNHLKSSAAIFNRWQDAANKVRYQYDAVLSGNQQTAWNRVMEDFIAGDGPDMLCVYATDEHLKTLCKKGYLLDLEPMIPQETLDHVFPGIIESGRIDGQLVGIGILGRPRVLIASDGLNENWTCLDALELIRKRKNLDGIFLSLDGNASPLLALAFLTVYHIENSPFIDWENGESHFEKPEFQELLELCKQYGKDSDASAAIQEFTTYYSSHSLNFAELAINERYLAYCPVDFNWNLYCSLREKFDDKFRFTGYPGQTGYCGYWNGVRLILVNARSEHQATAAEFLNFLLSSETLNEESLWETPSRDNAVRSTLSPTFQNMYKGQYSVEDYIDFLWELGPSPAYDEQLANIIAEEAAFFFSGSRDAVLTAEVIDNRVQSYLDKRK